jgi:hypothetical protein
VLGVPNLVPSHESTSSCRFRYLKFIKLITSGPDHAIRYECGHDVHMTYWVSGSNLLRGIQLDEAPTVVFSISNIKERKFLSSLTLPHVCPFLTPPVRSSSFFSLFPSVQHPSLSLFLH